MAAKIINLRVRVLKEDGRYVACVKVGKHQVAACEIGNTQRGAVGRALAVAGLKMKRRGK